VSINSNIDSKLTDAERKQHEKVEWNTHVVDEAVNETPDHQYVGEIALNKRGGVTVPESHLTYTPMDLKSRRDRGDKVIPFASYIDDEGEVCWVLNDVDGEACRLGYICENCLEWQASTVTLKCEWLHTPGSCGYEKQEF
jgi:hypothetical protein